MTLTLTLTLAVNLTVNLIRDLSYFSNVSGFGEAIAKGTPTAADLLTGMEAFLTQWRLESDAHTPSPDAIHAMNDFVLDALSQHIPQDIEVSSRTSISFLLFLFFCSC